MGFMLLILTDCCEVAVEKIKNELRIMPQIRSIHYLITHSIRILAIILFYHACYFNVAHKFLQNMGHHTTTKEILNVLLKSYSLGIYYSYAEMDLRNYMHRLF